MNRERFLELVDYRLFGNRMDPSQRAGIEAILDEWDLRRLLDLRQLAYILATVKWETAATMQPVREAYWLSENWRRINLRYYPYYGRGLVQITWERNYREMTRLLKARFTPRFLDFDMVKTPDLALDPAVAIAITFEGMFGGLFTGKSLEDYFTSTQTNWVGARKIINGTDRAAEIAQIAIDFHNCLLEKPVAARLLQFGMNGPDVTALQRALGPFYKGQLDEDFGPATRNAVIAFQKAHPECGDADGIVGPRTRAVLGV